LQRKCILFAICILISSAIIGFSSDLTHETANFSFSKNAIVSTDQLWSLTHGSWAGYNAFYSIISCREGGYAATGVIHYRGNQALTIVRISEDGQLLWHHAFDAFSAQVGREIIECESGGFAVIGYILDNNRDALLLRVDESGNIAWYQIFGGLQNFDQGHSLVECQSGGFAFAGFVMNENHTNSQSWLVRTDQAGNMIWSQEYGGLDDEICTSLVESESGNFILGGSTESYGNGNEDAWLLATTSQGVTIWNKTFGGIWSDVCYDVIETSRCSFVTVGETENASNLVSDGFATSYHRNGTFQWSTKFGGPSSDAANSITELTDGSFGIAGRTVEWEGNDHFDNLWLVRLTQEGDFLRCKNYGGTDDDEGCSILQTSQGDFIIAGHTESLAEHHSLAWALRIPDNSAIIPPVNTREYGPPNIFLISLGTGLAFLILLGSFLLFRQSRKELTLPWSYPSKRTVIKTYLSPRVIGDLSSILTGLTQCPKCNAILLKSESHCPKCSTLLHRCIFCDETISPDTPVIFCPSCAALAHHNHMIEWLAKRQFCPRCGLHFPDSSNPRPPT
jgi:hypothetical protein